jgi:COMPASS component SWD1
MTLELKASFRVTTTTSSTTALKSIEFARRGNCFLVNSSDRIIRVYESEEVLACGKDGEPEPIQKLQDLVNRSLWKKCCFSGDGEYIVAGSARQHSLYIWEKSSGNLVKFLLGTKGEMLLDVVWHPVRPIIASISSGVVSIWAQNQVENWSAFAPDFKELDENVEYDEHESEFDIEDEDKQVQETKGPCEEDIEVDVTEIEPIAAFVSSDEEEDDGKCLLFLPISPEIEDTEDAPGVEHASEEQQGDRKRSSSGKDQSPKKRKSKTIDIDLPNAPTDEIHPLLNVKKPQDKQTNRKPMVTKVTKGGKGLGQRADSGAVGKSKHLSTHKENSS